MRRVPPKNRHTLEGYLLIHLDIFDISKFKSEELLCGLAKCVRTLLILKKKNLVVVIFTLFLINLSRN